MQIKLNTNLVPLFSGTYESRWEVSEYNEEGTEEVEVDYEQVDLMESIAGVYQKNAGYILSELNCAFIKKLTFDGTFESPREYNFKTDVLDFTIEVVKTKLLNTLKSLKNDKKFEEFLRENYTSYDGFMSFTPNNYPDLYNEITGEGREFEQAIGALITYLAKSNITEHGGYSIEEMIHEDWQGNGYNGLSYSIVEFA
ncbi:MAG: hypothetical protein Q8O75_01160 [bacterium]|nr:hypothetical protein [bacterium]